ncbi:MAG: hypothetical protein ACREA2_08330, partial [Blastocatellia bacterium]
VEAGAVFALEAPRGKIHIGCLPSGAQTVKIVSPADGVPVTLAQSTPASQVAVDPAVAALQKEVAALKGNLKDPPNIAIYLIETAPIVATILEYYRAQGAVEITSLVGMEKMDFERNRINDLLFGPEAERPATAATIRERMNSVLARTSASTSAAGRILGNCANEILRAVDTCESYCAEYIRQRHLKIEDVNDGDPKRYSKHDLRALEFAGLARLQDAKKATVDLQEQSMRAIPAMFQMVAEQNARWGQLFERLIEKLDNPTPKRKGGE